MDEAESPKCTSCLGVVSPPHECHHCPVALLSQWHQCYDCLLPTETDPRSVYSDDYLCTCDRPTLAAVALASHAPELAAPGYDPRGLLESMRVSVRFPESSTLLTARVTDLPADLSPFGGSLARDNPRARVLEEQCPGLVSFREKLAKCRVPQRLCGIAGPALRAFNAPPGERFGEVQVVDASDVDLAAMWDRFVKHNIPVKVTGLMGPGSVWDGARGWTLETLGERCGDREITVRVNSTKGKTTAKTTSSSTAATAAATKTDDDDDDDDKGKKSADKDVLFGNLAVDTREDPIYEEVKVKFSEYLEATKLGRSCPYYAARLVLEKDLPELCREVPPDAFHRDCFGERLFAGVISYIGAGGNRTPTHIDTYENCLHVVRGSKEVILYHPSYADLMRPRTYGFNYSSVPGGTPPESPDFPLWRYVKGLKTTVNEGEMLYLPYAWWHDVTGGDGLNIIVNHWYEMRPEKRMAREVPIDWAGGKDGGKVKAAKEE